MTLQISMQGRILSVSISLEIRLWEMLCAEYILEDGEEQERIERHLIQEALI